MSVAERGVDADDLVDEALRVTGRQDRRALLACVCYGHTYIHMLVHMPMCMDMVMDICLGMSLKYGHLCKSINMLM